jgi:hypothetical protein
MTRSVSIPNRFVYYLGEFTQLDLVARGITDDPEAPGEPAKRVAYLEDKLSRLKAQKIQEFSDTKLYPERTMGTVMSLIFDMRASLNAQRVKLEEVRESGGDAHAPDASRPDNRSSSVHDPDLRNGTRSRLLDRQE